MAGKTKNSLATEARGNGKASGSVCARQWGEAPSFDSQTQMVVDADAVAARMEKMIWRYGDMESGGWRMDKGKKGDG